MNEEAKSLAMFLGEQGHSDPVVLILTPEAVLAHSDMEEWEGGCLQVWSEEDYSIPLTWKDIPVLYMQANIHDFMIEEKDDADWWKVAGESDE